MFNKISILYFSIFISSQIIALGNNIGKENKSINKFNEYMEEIYLSRKDRNKKQLCIQLSGAINIINTDLFLLNKIEPDYNWNEIKFALIDTQKMYC
tara:strand:+ start:115 stop:405 length:291 start_codon:yes stop_codon:yes gene_type:complete